MTVFLYWSGAVAWLAFGLVGIFLALDWAIDQLINSFKLKHEFLAFCWERLKSKRGRNV